MANYNRSSSLTAVRDVWEPKTTRNKLLMFRAARHSRGVAEPWLDKIIDELSAST
jgi:hypothetical protein